MKLFLKNGILYLVYNIGIFTNKVMNFVPDNMAIVLIRMQILLLGMNIPLEENLQFSLPANRALVVVGKYCKHEYSNIL